MKRGKTVIFNISDLNKSDKMGKKTLADLVQTARSNKAKIKSHGFTVESITEQIQHSANTKIPVDIHIDGNTIHITPDISEKIIELHDELNEHNQEKMRELLDFDTSSFVKLVRFAQER